MLRAIHQSILEHTPELKEWEHHINEKDSRLNYWCAGKTIVVIINQDRIDISYNGFIHYHYDINDPNCFSDLEDDMNEIIMVWCS